MDRGEKEEEEEARAEIWTKERRGKTVGEQKFSRILMYTCVRARIFREDVESLIALPALRERKRGTFFRSSYAARGISARNDQCNWLFE